MPLEDDRLNKAIADAFKSLPKKVVNKILKTHLKKYAKELQTEVKNQAPTDTNELKKKVKTKVGKRSTVAANYLIGVSIKDFKDPDNPKASIQEYGSVKKHMIPQPYMRPAFDKLAENITKNLTNDIIADVERELR